MTQALKQLTAKTLEQVAHGEPAAPILGNLCSGLEKVVPGTQVGVTVLDRTSRIFELGIFPSLSDDYGNALRGILVNDKPGSCALAVFDGKTVVCDDVASDERFSQGWKDLSLAHGLNALTSIPTMHRDGIALGTLVLAYQPGRTFSSDEQEMIDEAVQLCALVLTYRRAQLNHELMVGELQHRVRNLFSTVGAVVYATMRSHPEPEGFRKTFDARLAALARAHSLALEPGEAELRQLLVDTLAPYSIDHAIKIEGPPLVLSREAAVAFSLAAHELATNAAKYGAFSKPSGSVDINFGFEDSDKGAEFVLTWKEVGGPRVKAPIRQGYGQKTITRSLASAFDGAVHLDYDPGGLQCRIHAPQSERLGARLN